MNASFDVLDFAAPHRFVRVGPDEIATWRIGSGPDVVLVHGWPLHAATWRSIAPALAEHFTCHLIDLPGAGQTRSEAATPLSLRDLTRALLGAIDAIGIARCAFIAHDSGGAVTRLAAAELGDRVWATVMGNTEIPGHRPWLVTLMGLLFRLGGPRAFSTMLKSRTLRRSHFAYGSCFHDKRKIDGAFHDLFVAPLLSHENAAAQTRLLAGFDWGDVEGLDAVHASLKGPVQLVWGRRDPYFPLERAARMHFGAGSEVHVIDDAKLFVHEEHPDRFAAHARSFLREHAPGR